MTRKSILWAALLALLLLAISGAASAQTEPRSTSVQLSWFPNIEYAGLYEAERNGFFTAQGLTVELKPGGFDDAGVYIDPVNQVMNGNADFGITGAHVILTSRAEGRPLVAVAAIYQRTPVVLFSLPESNINRPEDLVGKRVGTQPDGSAIGIMFRALLASKNLTMDQIVATTGIDFNSPDPLLNGEVDVMQGFLTNQAVQARLRDPEVKIMLLSDYGIDFYSNVLFTTEQMIQEQPAMVQGMVQAMVDGLNSTVADPDAAAAYALEKYIANGADEQVRQVQIEGILTAIPLINPPNSRPGMMSADVWEHALDVLVSQNLIGATQDFNSAFTLDFVNQAYAGS